MRENRGSLNVRGARYTFWWTYFSQFWVLIKNTRCTRHTEFKHASAVFMKKWHERKLISLVIKGGLNETRKIRSTSFEQKLSTLHYEIIQVFLVKKASFFLNKIFFAIFFRKPTKKIFIQRILFWNYEVCKRVGNAEHYI